MQDQGGDLKPCNVMLRKHGPRLQCKPALAVWRQSVGYLHLEAIVWGDTAMYDVEAGQSRYSGHWQKIFNNKTERPG